MKTHCIHWKDCKVTGGGCCALGRFGGKPSHGICAICPDYAGRPRGLGDSVHRVAYPAGQLINRLTGRKLFGNGTCNCQKRRRRLNQWMAFRQKP